MLFLTRQLNQKIIIDFSKMTDEQLLRLRDRTVTVVITEQRNNGMRVGMDFPRDVQVDRE